MLVSRIYHYQLQQKEVNRNAADRFGKAVDSIWMKGLISKLIILNFPPYLINIIQSYLHNRTFLVQLENESPSTVVLLGLLLGFLIFNIYDLPHHPDADTYADDIAIYTTSSTMKVIVWKLQNHFSELLAYTNSWKLYNKYYENKLQCDEGYHVHQTKKISMHKGKIKIEYQYIMWKIRSNTRAS